MGVDDRSAYVTRREFNLAMGLSFLFILLVHSLDAEGKTWDWSKVMLLLSLFLMSMLYFLPSYWDARTRRERLKTAVPAPLSERVQEIARDPGRKIEAIKVHREETGAGLAEAKAAVDAYITSIPNL